MSRTRLTATSRTVPAIPSINHTSMSTKQSSFPYMTFPEFIDIYPEVVIERYLVLLLLVIYLLTDASGNML